jgi:glutathione peroxidase
MFSPIHVKGDNAHPLFREIARQSGTPPRWNFYKYVINRDGKVTAAFSSMTSPDSDKLRKAIEAVL